jgi:hypothetical protein
LLQFLAAASRSDVQFPDWCCPLSCKRIATVVRSGEKRHDNFSDVGATGETRRAALCDTLQDNVRSRCSDDAFSECEAAMTNWSRSCDQPEQRIKVNGRERSRESQPRIASRTDVRGDVNI